MQEVSEKRTEQYAQQEIPERARASTIKSNSNLVESFADSRVLENYQEDLEKGDFQR